VNTILQVYRKEVRDVLRDKRVRMTALFSPIFTMVLIVSLFGFITSQVTSAQKERIYIVKGTTPIASALHDQKLEIIEVPDVATGQKLIRDGTAKLVLNPLPPKPDGQLEIEAYLDPKEQRAQIELSALQKALDIQNKSLLASVLRENHLPPNSDQKFRVVEKDVQVGEKGGAGEFILGMLPYLIVVWAFYGGIGMATDLVAGEKEKNTLETLLISPAVRTHVVLGKFLALSTVCLCSSLSSFIGIALAVSLKLPGSSTLFKDGLGITPSAFAVTLVVLVPLVATFASLLLALSSFARNSRESQTYLAQLSLLVTMPALFSQFIGLTDAGRSLWINFIPVLNTANNIRSALMGKTDPTAVLLTVVVSLVIALGALSLTVHFFNREEVVLRV
jgi:sodium transport system permease protein